MQLRRETCFSVTFRHDTGCNKGLLLHSRLRAEGIQGEGFVFGCVYPEEDDRAAWAILLRKNRFSPGFVKFLPKFKKVLASYTGVRGMILSRKRGRIQKAC